MQVKKEKLAYWQLRPSLKYWKKSPNISNLISLVRNPKTTNNNEK